MEAAQWRFPLKSEIGIMPKWTSTWRQGRREIDVCLKHGAGHAAGADPS
jgi:hypothetical protein